MDAEGQAAPPVSVSFSKELPVTASLPNHTETTASSTAQQPEMVGALFQDVT